MFDRRLLSNFDWILFLLVMTISLIGVMAIYSASQGYTEPTRYWLRQLNWIALGTAAGFLVLLVDFRTIGNYAYLIHGGVVFSLLLLMFYGSGSGTVSVNRWFQVGPIAIQPSEFAKFSMVLALAFHFRDARRVGNIGWRGIIWPLVILLVPFFLIVRQPDLGTAVLLVMIFIPITLMAGVRMRLVVYSGAAGLLAIFALIGAFQFGYYQIDDTISPLLARRGADKALLEEVEALKGQRFYLRSSFNARLASFAVDEIGSSKAAAKHRLLIEQKSFHPFISKVLRPYQQRRLITFINPDQDPLGAGYHVIQSKVAIGSGRFWGKGYGESTQGSLNFLPARHTDFLFSIFSEEWGFVGATVLILLYLLLILRGGTTILQTHDRFSAFLILGILSIFTSQVLVNIGMAVGLLPVVGVPLPFFSYGGSSLITMMMGVGLILNIRMRRFLWS